MIARGWDSFLLSLDDDELDHIETCGQDARWPARTPASLAKLVEHAAIVCALPALSLPSGPGRPARRKESPRKRAQTEAFARLVLPVAARFTRVVDVGSGHGHLTRQITGETALPVVGLEREAALVARARTLSASPSPTFHVTDVLRDGLPLAEGDFVVGLHACGELGDVMVTSAARVRGVALALVGCCLQKRRQLARPPLVAVAALQDRLELPRALLGLSNLAPGDDGVEATRAENLAGRERRLALHRLLSEAGEPVRFGAEIEGLNRRVAQRGLGLLVRRAFALRGKPPPSHAAVEEAASWAREAHARARRLSLPRAMLARVLEVYVLFDRAAYLEQHGFSVDVGTLFPALVSARNLALLAR
ncbi:MAG TPA: methyltransferase [Polyangiaceae bacterium]|nr:methyltransferase [Polyangiaceae bacterium]